MARYIDKDMAINKFSKDSSIGCSIRSCIEEIPTVEVERGENGIDHCPLCGAYIITAEGMERERLAHTLPGQHGDPKGEPGIPANILEIEHAKNEVAREIFEEIEELLSHHYTEWDFCYYDDELGEDFAELKKKYTEEKDDG